MQRRKFLGVLLGAAASSAMLRSAAAYEVTKSDAEWKKILSPQAYEVLRHQDTEIPWSSKLEFEHRKGIYSCAGCNLPNYSSDTKYDSHTGWPSFWKPLPNAILTKADFSDGDQRTEVHCSRCGGHLGHVFADGPPPTGQRYCMNGVALKFVPAPAGSS